MLVGIDDGVVAEVGVEAWRMKSCWGDGEAEIVEESGIRELVCGEGSGLEQKEVGSKVVRRTRCSTVYRVVSK